MNLQFWKQNVNQVIVVESERVVNVKRIREIEVKNNLRVVDVEDWDDVSVTYYLSWLERKGGKNVSV